MKKIFVKLKNKSYRLSFVLETDSADECEAARKYMECIVRNKSQVCNNFLFNF